MIVCLCRGVSDAAVRAARDAGVHSIEGIGAATGAGTECGSCREAIARILGAPCGRAACGGRPGCGAVPGRIAAGPLETR